MTTNKSTRRVRDRKYHIIYKTTCSVTNKYYVGLHSTDDLDDGYKGSGTALRRSIKKHGYSAHTTEILEFCDNRQQLLLRESEIVNDEMVADPFCLNLMKGGHAMAEDHEFGITEITRAKMSSASKEFWVNLKANPEAYGAHLAKLNKPEHIAARAAGNIGVKVKDTSKMKAAQQRLAVETDPEIFKTRAAKANQTMLERGTRAGGRPKGVPMSEEQKKRQSEMAKNNPNSPLKIRVSCIHCRKETSLPGLTNFHKHLERAE